MKTAIFAIALIASANASAWGIGDSYRDANRNANKTITATPNVFGGYNYRNGHNQNIGSSSPNVFGGSNYRDGRGNNIGYSQPNVFGGTTLRKW